MVGNPKTGFLMTWLILYEPDHEKMDLQDSSTRQGINQPAQLQRLARVLKLEVSQYLCSEKQRLIRPDLGLCYLHYDILKTPFLWPGSFSSHYVPYLIQCLYDVNKINDYFETRQSSFHLVNAYTSTSL